MIKPQLAEDAVISEIRYPCIVQPKFDGVRALCADGLFTGRSLDPFAGFEITEYFSNPEFNGLDGEMVLGVNPLSIDRLCNRTTGAMGKFKGVKVMANLHWWIFDDVTDPTLPYKERFARATERVAKLNHHRIHIFPSDWVANRNELNKFIEGHLSAGAEGSIVRNPEAVVKQGRSTRAGQQLWRIKMWSHAEILVWKIVEGEENQNEAKINSLGKSERSSSKKGKVLNGQVGSLSGPLLEDILHPLTKKLLLKRGTMVTIGRGEMTEKEAIDYFKNPSKILKHIATFKFMPHGMMDKPRMPTFKSKRLPQDMS